MKFIMCDSNLNKNYKTTQLIKELQIALYAGIVLLI